MNIYKYISSELIILKVEGWILDAVRIRIMVSRNLDGIEIPGTDTVIIEGNEICLPNGEIWNLGGIDLAPGMKMKNDPMNFTEAELMNCVRIRAWKWK